MRYVKWLSLLAVLCLLCATLPAALADDALIVDQTSSVDGMLEIEPSVDGLAPDDAYDLPELDLPEAAIELDGLEDALSTEQAEAIGAPAAANDISDFEIVDGVLTKYNGFDKDVVIPDTVRIIGGEVFRDDKNMQTVSIPSSVQMIGSYAFIGCDNLKSVYIPDSVTEIEQGAFSYCPGIKSIRVSKNLTNWGSLVFNDCPELEEVVLPDGLTSLGAYAFSYCIKLKTVALPSTITSIGECAFSDCQGLVEIAIPQGVTSIEASVFSNCPSLESVTIPASVTSIDRAAFGGDNMVVIRGEAGTYAERYANGMGIPFNAPNIVITTDATVETPSLVVYRNFTGSLTAVQTPSDLATALKWTSSDPGVATVDENGNVKGIAQGTATITAETADGKGRPDSIEIIVPEPSTIDAPDWDDWDFYAGTSNTLYVSIETPYSDGAFRMPIKKCVSSDKKTVSVDGCEDDKVFVTAHRAGRFTLTLTLADGGEGTVEHEVLWQEVTSLRIDQTDPVILHPREKLALSAVIEPSAGTDPSAKLKWESSDPSVAKVSKKGVISAVSAGVTTISVCLESDSYIRNEITVLVYNAPKKIRLDKTSATLCVGDKLTLKPALSPDNADARLTWTSSDEKVATVSAKGRVKALKKGTATITVKTFNGKKATCRITVAPAPTKVTLNKSKATVYAGLKLALKAKVTPVGAKGNLTWSSSNRKVATVTQNGVVKALKKGTATITVRTGNGKKATCRITVPAAPTRIRFDKHSYSIQVGKALRLSAKLTPAKARTVLTWASSNKKIATVSDKGVVTGVKAGTATITVKTANGKAATVTINVQ